MKHLEDHTLDRMLRAHDAATSDTTDLRRRLDARLEVIIADCAAAGPAPATGTPAARRRLAPARLAGVAAAAVAATAAVLLLPGPGESAAYASWTATPQAVADQDRDVAARECREAQRGPWYARTDTAEFDAAAATLALAERRGDLVAVLLRDQGPTKDMSGFCVVELTEGASSAKVRDSGAAGSLGGPPSVAQPDSFVEGSMSQSGVGDGMISMMDGPVGDNVAGLTIHADGTTIEATVDNGRYAAWWPGRIFPDEDTGPSGEGGPEPILTYDLTLTDGTIITGAEPTPPQSP